VEKPIGLLSGVLCLLTYRACLAVFSRVPSHLRPIEVVHKPMEYLGKTCMTKGGVDLILEGILDDGVAVRGVRHTNSDLFIEGVLQNSVHLGVPIDRPVDVFDKHRIFLITTFEHVVPIGICREELGNFVCREALGLCKFHKIVVAVFANPLPMQVVLIGCYANSFRDIGGIGLSGRIEMEETFHGKGTLQPVVRHHN